MALSVPGNSLIQADREVGMQRLPTKLATQLRVINDIAPPIIPRLLLIASKQVKPLLELDFDQIT